MGCVVKKASHGIRLGSWERMSMLGWSWSLLDGIGGVHANAIPCLYAWDMDGWVCWLSNRLGAAPLRVLWRVFMLVFMKKKTKLLHDCTYIGTLPCFCIFVQGKVVGSCPVKAPSAVLSDINRRSPITLKFISDTNKILCSFKKKKKKKHENGRAQH